MKHPLREKGLGSKATPLPHHVAIDREAINFISSERGYMIHLIQFWRVTRGGWIDTHLTSKEASSLSTCSN